METVKFIGIVRSSLKEIKDCPLQEHEGGPPAIIEVNEAYKQAVSGLAVGCRILLLTWLHKADRNILTTKPRNNPNAKTTGIFATRSPDRPNPVGLHEAEILEIHHDGKIRISSLEVLDGTPVIDIKPVL